MLGGVGAHVVSWHLRLLALLCCRALIRGQVRFGRRSPDVSCQFVAATETCAGAFLVEFVCRTRHLLRPTRPPRFG